MDEQNSILKISHAGGNLEADLDNMSLKRKAIIMRDSVLGLKSSKGNSFYAESDTSQKQETSRVHAVLMMKQAAKTEDIQRPRRPSLVAS